MPTKKELEKENVKLKETIKQLENILDNMYSDYIGTNRSDVDPIYVKESMEAYIHFIYGDTPIEEHPSYIEVKELLEKDMPEYWKEEFKRLQKENPSTMIDGYMYFVKDFI